MGIWSTGYLSRPVTADHFFKAVFRRHTDFSSESIEQTWNGKISPGGKISVTISRQGDLLSDLILKQLV